MHLRVACHRMAAWSAALFLLSAPASHAADPDNGQRLAQRWCANCHVVDRAQTRGTEAPPFSAIARKPNFDATAVAFFLLNPHPRMPDFGLTRKEAEDLAAYIVQQR